MSLRKARPCLAATLWVAAVFAVGCASTSPPSPPSPPPPRVAPEPGGGGESVTFRPTTQAISPYAPVEIRLGLDDGLERVRSVSVHPGLAVIWVRSKNPIRQLLWTVRCVGRHGPHDYVLCPEGVGVILEPKKGCSRTLFGSNTEAGSGRLVIPPGYNALASGAPDPAEMEGLYELAATSESFCDGKTLRKDMAPMSYLEAKDTGRSDGWFYSVLVTQDGERVAIVDPGVWIEDDCC